MSVATSDHRYRVGQHDALPRGEGPGTEGQRIDDTEHCGVSPIFSASTTTAAAAKPRRLGKKSTEVFQIRQKGGQRRAFPENTAFLRQLQK